MLATYIYAYIVIQILIRRKEHKTLTFYLLMESDRKKRREEDVRLGGDGRDRKCHLILEILK